MSMTTTEADRAAAEAKAALWATPTSALLDAVIRLTHQIHDSGRREVSAAEYRTQRDMVRAEILRRTGA